MKKFVAMLLALMLALGYTSAMAEAIPEISGISVEAGIELDKDLFSVMALGGAADEQTQQAMNLLFAFLDNLTIKGEVDPEKGLEGTINLKGSPIASLNMYIDEQNITIVSDLFPNYALSVPQAALAATADEAFEEEMIAELTAMMPQIEAVLPAMANHFTAMLADFQTSLEKAETGNYTVNQTAFTHKDTYRMNAVQVMNFLKKHITSILTDSAVLNLVPAEMMGDLFSTLAEINATTDADVTNSGVSLEVTEYYNDNNADRHIVVRFCDGYDLMVISMTSVGQKTVFSYMMGDNEYYSDILMRKAAMEGNDVVLLECTLNMENGLDMMIDVYAQTYIGISFQGTPQADGSIAFQYGVHMISGYKPMMAVKGTISLTADVAPYVPGNKTVIAIDPTMNEEDLEKAMANLENDLAAFGLNSLITNIATIMPDELTQLITMASESNTLY